LPAPSSASDEVNDVCDWLTGLRNNGNGLRNNGN